MLAPRFPTAAKRLRAPAIVLVTSLASCVPSDPARTSEEQPAVTTATPKPARTTPPRAPTSARPKSSAPASKAVASKPLEGLFEDNFDRPQIGPDWNALSKAWQLKDGRLCGQGARNKGVWLLRSLPANARIEFEAASDSPDGDLKAEYWGDGRSGATATSYTDATSYLTIFGGWKNQFHVLARIDEHARDRKELRTDPESGEERLRPVVAGRTYLFKVERADGKTLSWWVDGHLIHRLEDPEPLTGPGHDHFGFNNWEVPVCFDNVKISPL